MMDYRQKMVVPQKCKIEENDDEDDEDLEALRLAALRSLRTKEPAGDKRRPPSRPVLTAPGPPHRSSNCPMYKGQRHGRRGFYHGRGGHFPNKGERNVNGNLYYQSPRNPNLIAIVPVEEDTISEVAKRSNDTLLFPTKPEKANTFESTGEYGAEVSKFQRYKDAGSGSEEEDSKDQKNVKWSDKNLSIKTESTKYNDNFQTAAPNQAKVEVKNESQSSPRETIDENELLEETLDEDKKESERITNVGGASHNNNNEEEEEEQFEDDQDRTDGDGAEDGDGDGDGDGEIDTKDEDDDDVLLMADHEEEDSLERLMDEMEREMNVDKPFEDKIKQAANKKEPSRQNPKTVKPVERQGVARKRKSASPSNNVSSAAVRNERRSTSPRRTNKACYRRRSSLSPKSRARKRSPRRSPRRSPPRRSSPVRQLTKRSNVPKNEPVSRYRSSPVPRKSPSRYSPRRSPVRRSPERRRASPLQRTRRSSSRSLSPSCAIPRPMRSHRSSRSPTSRYSPPHGSSLSQPLSPCRTKRLSRSKSPVANRDTGKLSPRLSPRRSSPWSNSPRSSPYCHAGESSPPRRSKRSSPKWSPRETSLRKATRQRSVSPDNGRRRASNSPEFNRNSKSKYHRRKENPEKKVPVVKEQPAVEVTSDPILEARRRKFESTKPIDPVTANKKIKLSRKDNDNHASNDVASESGNNEFSSRKSRKMVGLESTALTDSQDAADSVIYNSYEDSHEDGMYANDVITVEGDDEENNTDENNGSPSINLIEEGVVDEALEEDEDEEEEEEKEEDDMDRGEEAHDLPVLISLPNSNSSDVDSSKESKSPPPRKRKKRDKEIYQVSKLKTELPLSERIVKEKKKRKKCKKRKENAVAVNVDTREQVTNIFDEVPVDEEADLRTELSRRRAERLNRNVPIQSARLLQSAFKGVVNDAVKSNAKVNQRHTTMKLEDKPLQKEIRRVTVLHRTIADLHDQKDHENPLDTKIPVRFRLGLNKTPASTTQTTQDEREATVSRKLLKRQSRKVKHKVGNKESDHIK